MTEPRDMEPFETQFADRVRAYTDRAIERRVDALAVSRTAMSSKAATGWSLRWPGAWSLGQRVVGVRWAVALVAIVLVGIVGVAVGGRLSEFRIATPPTPSPVASPSGPIPDDLRHAWQRPMLIAPGPDVYGGGTLVVADEDLNVGRTPAAATRSAISATGLDTILATATAATQGCAVGDVGAYHWLVEGKGTVLTLTAINADACVARQEALAGPWVRSDLPVHQEEGTPLQPGTYRTSGFDPLDTPGLSQQLSYTVPEGWKVKEDEPATFLLHHLPDPAASPPSTDVFVSLFSHPRLAADFADGATCGPTGEVPGAEHGVDELVAAITARPGVVSTLAAVTIGGYEGKILDLSLDPSWTGGCLAPEGPIVAVPMLVEAGSDTGPIVGLGSGQRVRLILLDLTGGRTMSITIFGLAPASAAAFDTQVADAMPVIESIELHPAAP
jgi:hypothetical protein